MDELIALLIKGLVALLSGDSGRNRSAPPVSRPLPPQAPLPPQVPFSPGAPPPLSGGRPRPGVRQADTQSNRMAATKRAAVQRIKDVATGRQQSMRKALTKQVGKRAPAIQRLAGAASIPLPPPIPHQSQLSKDADKADLAAAKAAAAPPVRPAISAEGISSLMRSRPNALRTIFVLSEILQAPLSMREER